MAEGSCVVSAVYTDTFAARSVCLVKSYAQRVCCGELVQSIAPGLTDGKAGLKSRLNLFLAPECQATQSLPQESA